MTTTTIPAFRVTLPRVIRGELVKLRGQRSTLWILGLTLTVPPLASLVWAANSAPASSSAFDQLDAVVGATTSSLFEILVLVVLFGSLVASTETDSRTITTTMAAVPRRWPVVTAKAIVVAVVTFVLVLVSGTLGFLLSSLVVPTANPVSLADPGVLRVLLGLAVFATGAAAIALSAALIIRSSLGAVAATFGFLYVVPGALGLIPLTPIEVFAKTFPGPASNSLIALVDSAGNLPYGLSLLAIIAWTLITVATAIAVVRHRDI